MLYSRPDYYTEFKCAADACEDTCCAGWQIAVDDVSLRKYRAVKGKFQRKLRRGIDWKHHVFYQSQEKRCAFLNDNNLCDLYAHLGRKSLCKTCRRYPRHVEEFEGVREITLSLSCPKVAQILMNREAPVTFQYAQTERQEQYEDFDELLYSILCDGREVMMKILQNRSLPVPVRERLVYGIAHDMQVRARQQRIFFCAEVFEKYQKAAAARFARKQWDADRRDTGQRFENAKKNFRGLFQLELLRQEWDIQLLEVEQKLFLGHTALEYEKISREFEAWVDTNFRKWEIQKEQLLVYFISTYFCGAVYDGQILPKVKMALLSVNALEEILKTRWLENEKTLDAEDVIDVVYRYSREVEHSDENLRRIETLEYVL